MTQNIPVKSFFFNENLIYVVKRLSQGLLTLLLASMLSFIIIQLAPGDYLDNLRQNPTISPETIDELQIRFGLDKPPLQQYLLWLRQVVTRLILEKVLFILARFLPLLLSEFPPLYY